MKKKRNRALCLARKILILLISLSFGITCLPSSVKASNDEQNSAVNQALKGVVRIIAFDNNSDGYATGSGFGIGRAGEATDTFITNWHVVTDNVMVENETTNKVEITYQKTYDNIYLLLEDATVFDNQGNIVADSDCLVKCEVVSTTEGYPDWAIIKAERKIDERIALPLMPAEEAEQTDTVYAAGFPGVGDDINTQTALSASTSGLTATMGTISRFNVDSAFGDTKVIQMDLQISHGNSGGPLLTENGAVIGINTYGHTQVDGYTQLEDDSMAASTVDINEAVYIDYVMDELDRLGIDYDIYEAPSVFEKYPFIIPIIVGVLLIFILLFIYINKSKKADEKKKKEIENLISQMKGEVDEAKKEAMALKVKMLEEERKRQASTMFKPWTKPAGGGHKIISEPGSDTGFRLQSLEGAFRGRRFAMIQLTKLGTDQSNNIVFPAGTKGVSRKHCELMIREGSVYLRDVGSSYGTFYKNRKIPPNQWIKLNVGDVFYLATATESFRIDRKS